MGKIGLTRKHLKSKKTRRVLEIKVKLEILDRLQRGEKAANIARSMRLPESTVRTVRANEHRLRECVDAQMSSHTNITKRRHPAMERMEKILFTWVQESVQKEEPISGAIIQQEAQKILIQVKRKDENIKFNASRGWLENFKKRYLIHSLSGYDELSHEQSPARRACSTDETLESNRFSTEKLTAFFYHIEEALRILKKDPDTQRSAEVSAAILNDIAIYRELDDIKKLEEDETIDLNTTMALCEAEVNPLEPDEVLLGTDENPVETEENSLEMEACVVISSDEE